MLYLAMAILGLAVGSFLNVCISRLPAGESVFSPPFPEASFSARCLLVQFTTGGLFLWSFALFGFGPELAKALILVAFLIVVTFIDYDHRLIFDKTLLWTAGAGAAINMAIGGYVAPTATVSFLNMLGGSLLGGGLMLIIAVVSRGGMGGGDIKFAAVLGLWFGWQHTLVALLLSFLIAGVGGAALIALKIKGRKDFIPFGPFIAIGALITLFYGYQLVAWYLRPQTM